MLRSHHYVGMQKCTRMTTEIRSIISQVLINKTKVSVKDSVIIVNQSDVDSDAEKEVDFENNEAASCESSVHEAFFKLRIEEQKDIVVKFLNNHSKDDIFELTSKNNTKCMWVRYPCAKNTKTEKSMEDHWRHFSKNIMPHNFLTKILSALCLSSSVAVYCLARALMLIDQASCIGGVKAGGGLVAVKLNGYQTLALQEEAGLSTEKRILIGRILRYYLNVSVLADERECSQIRNPYSPVPFFDTIQYYAKKLGSSDNPELSLKYYSFDPFDVLICRLKVLRSKIEETKAKGGFGMNFGEEGNAIALTLGADHGDTEMKFNATIHAREGDGQSQIADLGCFKGKETHYFLEHTILKQDGPYRSGLRKLNESFFLCAEWEDGIDFIFIDKVHCSQVE